MSVLEGEESYEGSVRGERVPDARAEPADKADAFRQKVAVLERENVRLHSECEQWRARCFVDRKGTHLDLIEARKGLDELSAKVASARAADINLLDDQQKKLAEQQFLIEHLNNEVLNLDALAKSREEDAEVLRRELKEAKMQHEREIAFVIEQCSVKINEHTSDCEERVRAALSQGTVEKKQSVAIKEREAHRIQQEFDKELSKKDKAMRKLAKEHTRKARELEMAADMAIQANMALEEEIDILRMRESEIEREAAGKRAYVEAQLATVRIECDNLMCEVLESVEYLNMVSEGMEQLIAQNRDFADQAVSAYEALDRLENEMQDANVIMAELSSEVVSLRLQLSHHTASAPLPAVSAATPEPTAEELMSPPKEEEPARQEATVTTVDAESMTVEADPLPLQTLPSQISQAHKKASTPSKTRVVVRKHGQALNASKPAKGAAASHAPSEGAASEGKEAAVHGKKGKTRIAARGEVNVDVLVDEVLSQRDELSMLQEKLGKEGVVRSTLHQELQEWRRRLRVTEMERDEALRDAKEARAHAERRMKQLQTARAAGRRDVEAVLSAKTALIREIEAKSQECAELERQLREADKRAAKSAENARLVKARTELLEQGWERAQAEAATALQIEKERYEVALVKIEARANALSEMLEQAEKERISLQQNAKGSQMALSELGNPSSSSRPPQTKRVGVRVRLSMILDTKLCDIGDTSHFLEDLRKDLSEASSLPISCVEAVGISEDGDENGVCVEMDICDAGDECTKEVLDGGAVAAGMRLLKQSRDHASKLLSGVVSKLLSSMTLVALDEDLERGHAIGVDKQEAAPQAEPSSGGRGCTCDCAVSLEDAREAISQLQQLYTTAVGQLLDERSAPHSGMLAKDIETGRRGFRGLTEGKGMRVKEPSRALQEKQGKSGRQPIGESEQELEQDNILGAELHSEELRVERELWEAERREWERERAELRAAQDERDLEIEMSKEQKKRGHEEREKERKEEKESEKAREYARESHREREREWAEEKERGAEQILQLKREVASLENQAAALKQELRSKEAVWKQTTQAMEERCVMMEGGEGESRGQLASLSERLSKRDEEVLNLTTEVSALRSEVLRVESEVARERTGWGEKLAAMRREHEERERTREQDRERERDADKALREKLLQMMGSTTLQSRAASQVSGQPPTDPPEVDASVLRSVVSPELQTSLGQTQTEDDAAQNHSQISASPKADLHFSDAEIQTETIAHEAESHPSPVKPETAHAEMQTELDTEQPSPPPSSGKPSKSPSYLSATKSFLAATSPSPAKVSKSGCSHSQLSSPSKGASAPGGGRSSASAQAVTDEMQRRMRDAEEDVRNAEVQLEAERAECDALKEQLADARAFLRTAEARLAASREECNGRVAQLGQRDASSREDSLAVDPQGEEVASVDSSLRVHLHAQKERISRSLDALIGAWEDRARWRLMKAAWGHWVSAAALSSSTKALKAVQESNSQASREIEALQQAVASRGTLFEEASKKIAGLEMTVEQYASRAQQVISTEREDKPNVPEAAAQGQAADVAHDQDATPAADDVISTPREEGGPEHVDDSLASVERQALRRRICELDKECEGKDAIIAGLRARNSHQEDLRETTDRQLADLDRRMRTYLRERGVADVAAPPAEAAEDEVPLFMQLLLDGVRPTARVAAAEALFEALCVLIDSGEDEVRFMRSEVTRHVDALVFEMSEIGCELECGVAAMQSEVAESVVMKEGIDARKSPSSCDVGTQMQDESVVASTQTAPSAGSESSVDSLGSPRRADEKVGVDSLGSPRKDREDGEAEMLRGVIEVKEKMIAGLKARLKAAVDTSISSIKEGARLVEEKSVQLEDKIQECEELKRRLAEAENSESALLQRQTDLQQQLNTHTRALEQKDRVLGQQLAESQQKTLARQRQLLEVELLALAPAGSGGKHVLVENLRSELAEAAAQAQGLTAERDSLRLQLQQKSRDMDALNNTLKLYSQAWSKSRAKAEQARRPEDSVQEQTSIEELRELALAAPELSFEGSAVTAQRGRVRELEDLVGQLEADRRKKEQVEDYMKERISQLEVALLANHHSSSGGSRSAKDSGSRSAKDKDPKTVQV